MTSDEPLAIEKSLTMSLAEKASVFEDKEISSRKTSVQESSSRKTSVKEAISGTHKTIEEETGQLIRKTSKGREAERKISQQEAINVTQSTAQENVSELTTPRWGKPVKATKKISFEEAIDVTEPMAQTEADFVDIPKSTQATRKMAVSQMEKEAINISHSTTQEHVDEFTTQRKPIKATKKISFEEAVDVIEPIAQMDTSEFVDTRKTSESAIRTITEREAVNINQPTPQEHVAEFQSERWGKSTATRQVSVREALNVTEPMAQTDTSEFANIRKTSEAATRTITEREALNISQPTTQEYVGEFQSQRWGKSTATRQVSVREAVNVTEPMAQTGTTEFANIRKTTEAATRTITEREAVNISQPTTQEHVGEFQSQRWGKSTATRQVSVREALDVSQPITQSVTGDLVNIREKAQGIRSTEPANMTSTAEMSKPTVKENRINETKICFRENKAIVESESTAEDHTDEFVKTSRQPTQATRKISPTQALNITQPVTEEHTTQLAPLKKQTTHGEITEEPSKTSRAEITEPVTQQHLEAAKVDKPTRPHGTLRGTRKVSQEASFDEHIIEESGELASTPSQEYVALPGEMHLQQALNVSQTVTHEQTDDFRKSRWGQETQATRKISLTQAVDVTQPTPEEQAVKLAPAKREAKRGEISEEPEQVVLKPTNATRPAIQQHTAEVVNLKKTQKRETTTETSSRDIQLRKAVDKTQHTTVEQTDVLESRWGQPTEAQRKMSLKQAVNVTQSTSHEDSVEMNAQTTSVERIKSTRNVSIREAFDVTQPTTQEQTVELVKQYPTKVNESPLLTILLIKKNK